MFQLHYLHHTLKRELTELYTSTVLRSLAASMMGMFAPLYLFHLGYSLTQILLFMALEYAVFAISSVTLGAHSVVHVGHERSIAFSTPLLLAYFALMYELASTPSYFYLIALVLGIHNGLYWVAYHSEFAHVGNRREMGSEIGLLKVFIGVMSIIAPAIAGYLIEGFGFAALFAVSAGLSLLSLIPLLKTPVPWKPGMISTRRILSMFTNIKYRGDLIANMGTGEDVIASTVWPVFLFLIIPSYHDVGILTTIATSLTFMLFLWLGKISDHTAKLPLVKRVGGLITISWIARMLAVTPFAALLSDTFYKISVESRSVPLTAMLYTRTKSHEIIEYTSFWMAALSIGKMSAALLAALIVSYTSNLAYTFLLAAVLSLLYFIWSDAHKKSIILK